VWLAKSFGAFPSMLKALVAVLLATSAYSSRPAHSSIDEVELNFVRSNSTAADKPMMYELLGGDKEKTSKITLVVVSLLLFGTCGVDRCVAGQAGLGFAKWGTGVFISMILPCCGAPKWFVAVPNPWWIIDDVLIIVNTLDKARSLTAFGWDATFSEESTNDAFVWGCIMAVFHVFVFIGNIGQIKLVMAADAMGQDALAIAAATARQQNSQFVAPVPAPFEIKSVFKRMDTNKDGSIDKTELRECLQKLGLQTDDAFVNKLMDDGDLDKNGTLDAEEFEKLLYQNADMLNRAKDLDKESDKPPEKPAASADTADQSSN